MDTRGNSNALQRARSRYKVIPKLTAPVGAPGDNQKSLQPASSGAYRE